MPIDSCAGNADLTDAFERLALIGLSVHVGTTLVAEVVSQHLDRVRREFLGIEFDIGTLVLSRHKPTGSGQSPFFRPVGLFHTTPLAIRRGCDHSGVSESASEVTIAQTPIRPSCTPAL